MSRFSARLQRGAGGTAQAALYLSPAITTTTNGSTVVVTIRENSYATGVNGVQANLTYPAGLLQYQTANTGGGAFSTTLQKTGGSGTVQIAVGLLGGSVSGDQVVATVTFTALAVGNARVQFDTGSAVTDAATAANICRVSNGASVTIT